MSGAGPNPSRFGQSPRSTRIRIRSRHTPTTPRAHAACRNRAPYSGGAKGACIAEQSRQPWRTRRGSLRPGTGRRGSLRPGTRVEELQRPRAHGAASQPPGRSEVSLDTPFPSHECREFLAEIYHEAWGAMRSALEDDACIVSALKENTEKVEGDGGGKEMEGSHPRETETGRSGPGQGVRGTGKATCLRGTRVPAINSASKRVAVHPTTLFFS
jgi:hypothetical protein